MSYDRGGFPGATFRRLGARTLEQQPIQNQHVMISLNHFKMHSFLRVLKLQDTEGIGAC